MKQALLVAAAACCLLVVEAAGPKAGKVINTGDNVNDANRAMSKEYGVAGDGYGKVRGGNVVKPRAQIVNADKAYAESNAKVNAMEQREAENGMANSVKEATRRRQVRCCRILMM